MIVPDDQLSLAIGKDGLNARLAARLTGWRVDIRSETEFAEEEAEMGYAEEEVAGRCAAILANGKRCPNASLPGSRYCGLPAHQALDDQETDYVVPPEEGARTASPRSAADEAAAAEESLGRGGRPRRGPRRRSSSRTPTPSRRRPRSRISPPPQEVLDEEPRPRTPPRPSRSPSRRGAGWRKSSRRSAAPLRRLPPLAPEARAAAAGARARTARSGWIPPGRPRGGAPTCAPARSAPRARSRGRPLARAFRAPVTVQQETIDLVREWQRSASTR